MQYILKDHRNIQSITEKMLISDVLLNWNLLRLSQAEMGRYILFINGSLFLCACSYSSNVQTFQGNIYFIQNYMYDLKA